MNEQLRAGPSYRHRAACLATPLPNFNRNSKGILQSPMKRIISTTVLAGALLALSALAGPLHAGVIYLDSAAGLLNSASPLTVAITPHDLWQTNNPVNP